MTEAPQAFVCHASEDKQRFVFDFARRLRERGIDAWLDRWEILPGDSLEERIFDEGLKNARAVVVVISRASIDKGWVKRELNAALIERITRKAKLIPVVLDCCPVPESLRDTAWEPIANIADYGESLDRIVASIFGAANRPQVGPAPAFANAILSEIAGLTALDNLVLKIACEEAISTGDHLTHTKKLYFSDGQPLIPVTELADSLEMLSRHYYIKCSQEKTTLPSFLLTALGLDTYAKAYIPEQYQAVQNDVVIAIVNENIGDNKEIQTRTGHPLRLIDTFLDILEMNGHVSLHKVLSGNIRVFNPSPALRRALA